MNKPFTVEVRKKENFTPEQIEICKAAAARHKERNHERRKAIRSMSQKVMTSILMEGVMEDGISAPHNPDHVQEVSNFVVSECTKIFDAIGAAKIEDRTYEYPSA